jgi:4-carboxymuconolactone decarboxylase
MIAHPARKETAMDKALRDKGLANRKAVLGEDYVNKSMAAADAFNQPFQEILNEYCWGLVWGDERLPKKTRSMLNLVMLACLGRMHEWELHLKGALNNGVSKDEIQAIIHQIAIYAGVPLGVECFRAARKVFAEVGKGA